jgi:tetratricopeptide (TPR) repeat protein
MAKIGRNDPCPCGSGKKYKKCCGAGQRLAAVPSPVFDPRSTEQAMAELSRMLLEGELASPGEMSAFLRQALDDSDWEPLPPRTPLEQAQQLIYDAWEATGKRRTTLARQALAISPDCADAYVLLAEESARTPEEARDLYAQGVAAGERALGKDCFEQQAGHSWGILETRPYMRARAGLASCLWLGGQRQEAIEHWTDMLRLNPGDNQGLRYLLLAALLERGDDVRVEALLKRYRGDAAASWAYGRALVAFRTRGDTGVANRTRTNAIATNPYVPAYLTGRKKLPRTMPEYVGFGDETEAVTCAAEQLAAWRGSPGALAWLERAEPDGGGRPPPTGTVYQLKVTLKGTRPPVWRRLQVPADTRLSKLHDILQVAMGWTDSHLHQFQVGRRVIGVPDPDDWREVEDERRVRLADVASREKARLTYEYDFGDSWEHEVVVEKILPAEARVRLPVCLAGRRACPPEDVGGVWGYADFLVAIQDPRHPEHAAMLDWIGGEFEPEAFDPAEISAALRRLR